MIDQKVNSLVFDIIVGKEGIAHFQPQVGLAFDFREFFDLRKRLVQKKGSLFTYHMFHALRSMIATA